MLKLTLPLPPPLNATYRTKFTGGMYKTNFAKDWKKEVMILTKQELIKNGLIATPENKTDKYEVDIQMYLKRSRDIDSSIKLLLDAFERVIYANDNQVVKLTVEKWKSNDPRMEVEIKNSNRK
jgi:Holliday junction resolvase RusA-like endonuclease